MTSATEDRALSSGSGQPIFYAAVAFSSGIVLGTYTWRPLSWWVAATLILFASAVLLWRRRIAASAILSLATILFLGTLHAQLNLASPATLPDIAPFADETEHTVIAHVLRSGLIKSSAAASYSGDASLHEHRQTLDLETEQIIVDGMPHDIQAGVRATLHTKPAVANANENDVQTDDDPELPAKSAYFYGDRIQFSAKLRVPHNYGNPGSMDYRGYLLSNGIVAQTSIRADKIKKLPGFYGTKLAYMRAHMRRSLVAHMLSFATPKHGNRITKLFSMDQEEAGVLAAMIIGEQSLIGRATKTDFQRTGAFHLLVVSGMNVAILAFVIFWLAKVLRAGEVSATLATIVLSLLYAYMTDLGTPVIRAALMLSLFLGAKLIFRDRFSLNSIGTAALLMLLSDPQNLYQASFQLTFLSVVVLSGIVQPLLERTSMPYRRAISGLEFVGYDATLPPKLAQFRLDLRMIAARFAKFWDSKLLFTFLPKHRATPFSRWVLVKMVALSLAAYDLIVLTSLIQISLALPMSFYFHRMALLGLPTNMIIVPLTGVLMPVGMAATLISYLSPILARLPIMITALTLHGITGTVQHFGGMRFAEIRTAMPSLVLAFIASSAFVFAMFAIRRHRLLAASSLVGLCAAAILLTLPPKPDFHPGVAEVTAIDVGQGDSILVVSPEGRTLLIDGGGPAGPMRSELFEVGEDVVSPYLWSRGITRLDAIALTHAHSDHLSGLRSVMSNFHPHELWVGSNPPTGAYLALLRQAADQHVGTLKLAAGDGIDFGGLRFQVLAPAIGWQPLLRARNDDSLVLQMKFGETSALLTGDIEKRVERSLAESIAHADLLKVAHHGSATSTTPELLAAVHPRYAVISVGYRSIFGHPKLQTLSRLTAAHVQTFRTDIDGAVTFYLDGKTVTPAPAH